MNKKITELTQAPLPDGSDVGVLVRNDADYQFTFASLLQYIGSNLPVGASVNFGITMPQDNTGNNGDIFINIKDNSFAQKVNRAWAVKYQYPLNNKNANIIFNPGTLSNTTGNDNDTYVNTLSGIFYKKTGDAWVQVFSMATGPVGPPGIKGDPGLNGDRGNAVLNGIGNPSNVTDGTDGDFYINTATITLFGPKANGAWPSGYGLIKGGYYEILSNDPRLTTPAPGTLRLQWSDDLIDQFGSDIRQIMYLSAEVPTGPYKWNTSIQPIYNTTYTGKVASIEIEGIYDAYYKLFITGIDVINATINAGAGGSGGTSTFAGLQGNPTDNNALAEIVDNLHGDIDDKVDKVTGKGLSTEDYTTTEKAKLAQQSGVNTGDQDLSGKVDKITGKGLSTEDYTTTEKAKLAQQSGVNTGDQDLSGKVDKITGKGLSTEDYTTTEKAKLAQQSGVNTGDQDLSGIATNAAAITALANSKAQANGLAPLGADSKIPAAYLPSYVDDVLEFANLTALPTIGETGKIYITLNDNAEYRWGGSTYIQLVASPGSTDAVPEGTTNKYFTTSRVLNTLLAGLTAITGTPTASDSILSFANKVLYFINNINTTIGAYITNSGKQLSTEDYSTVEKNKLNGISANATANAAATLTETNAGADASKFITPTDIAGSKYLDQSGSKNYVALTYTSNAYTGNLIPAITAYNVGLTVTVKIVAPNTAVNPTIALNGLSLVPIYKNNGTALEIGDLQPGYYTLVYGTGSAFYLECSPLQLATDAETQLTTGLSSSKFITPQRLYNWLTWVKTQAQTFAVKLNSSVFGITPLTNNAAPSDGDLWYNSDLLFRDSTFNNKILKQQNNSSFVGSTTRMASFNLAGDLVASQDVLDGFIIDTDVIAAITAATYTTGKATITPANSKYAYQGQLYQAGAYLYMAVQDNVIFRIAGA